MLRLHWTVGKDSVPIHCMVSVSFNVNMLSFITSGVCHVLAYCNHVMLSRHMIMFSANLLAKIHCGSFIMVLIFHEVVIKSIFKPGV